MFTVALIRASVDAAKHLTAIWNHQNIQTSIQSSSTIQVTSRIINIKKFSLEVEQPGSVDDVVGSVTMPL